MITTRQSGARRKNAAVRPVEGPGSNTEWIASLDDDVARPGAIVLLGGSNVVDFRLRVAQSHLRHDMMPSFWSQVGVLVSRDTFLTVPLDERLQPSRVAAINAIHECRLAAYDEPARYPNVAIVNFAEPGDSIVDNARRLQTQRSAIDLPNLLVTWLAFAWGAAATPNPLTRNVGIPGAALVETAFGIAGIELTPGVASAASCPEAIWQSAIWWHEYYAQTADAMVEGHRRRTAAEGEEPIATGIVPAGVFVTRQPGAAVVELEPRRTRRASSTASAAPGRGAAPRRRASRRRSR
jgi:hypothetical protein